MQFSVQVGNDNVSWSTLRDIAKTVDNGSWHTLWNYDHLVPPHAELLPHLTDDLTSYEEGELLEGWSILSAWAAHTARSSGVSRHGYPVSQPRPLSQNGCDRGPYQ